MWLYILIAMVIYAFVFHKSEFYENTKTVTNIAKCKKCTIWNQRDAQSKCDRLCKVQYPGKDVGFTGEWSKFKDGAICECSFEGQYKKQYAGCPTNKSLGTNDCFFFNDKEAQQHCQYACDKFLPGKLSKWTGEWKNTSIQTSACECEYYD